jgi:hypothetical protein
VLWDVLWKDVSELVTKVCSLVRGNLTEPEWATLTGGLNYRATCRD